MRNLLPHKLPDNDELVFVILKVGVGTARQHCSERKVKAGEAVVIADDAQESFSRPFAGRGRQSARLAPRPTDAERSIF